jgi:FkbM family methyltransferase
LEDRVSIVASLRHEAGRRIRNSRRSRLDGVGHDFVRDIRERLPQLTIRAIFDVGAHIGMTALEFSDEFPAAEVWAFEPHPANFARMKSNLVGKPDIRLHQIGLGGEPGTLPFHFDPAHPSMARIPVDGELVTDTVDIDTIDRFAAANRIGDVDLLKIDVEGHELEVLAGASRMLSDQRIAIIRLETALDPDLPYHTQLWDICGVLHPFGYRLFGFYDQWEDMIDRNPRLRRFDAAFLSARYQAPLPSPLD